ncbi:ARF GAP [Giardia lamblia P15]|uniref:ARF GAP n=1 Tax=Giardia intestinalis (strain P15) TaxID=658858 RepID=E1F0N6_GIAIA|nr:ARF GAP [Giardia lamblia P15]
MLYLKNTMSERDQQRVKNAIDALRRKPENKQCADCKSLSVPYINLTCGTFVCARCAGIHREFDHRVKSVSNSVFKLDEIQALGGNDLDKRTYLPYWSEQVFKLPEPGSEDNGRVRDFIRMKYVEKKFCHEQPQQEVLQVPAFAGAPGVTQQITPDVTPQLPQPVSAFGMPQMGMGMKPMGMPAFARPSGMVQQPTMGMMQQPAAQQLSGVMQPGMMQQTTPAMFTAPAVAAVPTPVPSTIPGMPAAAPMPPQQVSMAQFSGAVGAVPSISGSQPVPSTPSITPMPSIPAMPIQPSAPMIPGSTSAPLPQAVPQTDMMRPGLDLFSNAVPVPSQPPVVPMAPVQPTAIPGVVSAPSQAPVTMPTAAPPLVPVAAPAPAAVPAIAPTPAPALISAPAPAPAPKTTNFNSLLDF